MTVRAAALSVPFLIVVGCREPAPRSEPVVGNPPDPNATAQPSALQSAAPPSAAASAEPALPKPGDPAPALVATASNGEKVDLAALKGKHVVVYFYPKDDTPGCTKEACAFRDAWAKLEKAGIRIIGVSTDDDASHQAFAKKHALPFPLVADVDRSICKRFGVPMIKDAYASRVSFLVGPDGAIKKVYPEVDPAVHADEILADAT